MLPGLDIIIRCPYCDNKLKQETLKWGNTINAKYWTDGKREAPMLPDGIVVTICKKCNNYFWVEYAEIIDEVDPSEEKYTDLEYLEELTFEQYIDSLQKIEIRIEEDTCYLLRQIWWKYNDYFRENNEAELSQEIKNKIPDLLNKLLNIFDENVDNDLMMKGELLRELGRFAEAEKKLNKINTPQYSQAKQFILDLAKNEVSELRELKF
ncbi:MAG: hypothetical protein R6V14_05255 [Halanaerobiales bacterium]